MSGIQFSSPVTNQKASPAVYASSLATRPAPQLPGRIFVDTDNPSTGMYRDTGTVWVQLSSGSGTVPDLQTVCNVGFLTDTDMTFLYTNSADTSKIGFFNQAVGDFAFDIFKKANELFAIRALKPSTVDEEMELIFDAPGNTIKTSYNSIVTGVTLDFFNNQFTFGDSNGNINGIGLLIDGTIRSAILGDIQNYGGNTILKVDDNSSIISTQYGGNDKGIILNFNTQSYGIGENYGSQGSLYIDNINGESYLSNYVLFLGSQFGNGTQLEINDTSKKFETQSGGNYTGISLDCANNIYRLGNYTSATLTQRGIYVDAIGEVGIGNQNPAYLLDVTGTLRSTQGASFATSSGSVGIGTTSPNASALLDITSTTKGVLLPRMTTTQVNAIVTPANGLLVYNTTIDHFCGYQAGAWVRFSHSPM